MMWRSGGLIDLMAFEPFNNRTLVMWMQGVEHSSIAMNESSIRRSSAKTPTDDVLLHFPNELTIGFVRSIN
jgi:hypothetical protein